jgi:hypothetical protein
MNDASTQHDHGGDAGADEPDVGQTSTEDLGQSADDQDEAQHRSGAPDDDIAAGHLGEVGGPEWSRRD